MAKPDYVPHQEAKFLAWHDQFKTQLASLAASLGISASEVTDVDDDNSAVHTKHITAADAKTVQEAATRDKNLTFDRAKGRARALAKRIKAHPEYTATIGHQLGIIRPEDPLAAAKAST